MILVGLFGLALGFNASTLDPFIYNEKIRLLAPPGLKNALLGLVTIAALLVALLVQPLVGQWSDRTTGRWGRRAPYLLAGTVGISFALVLVVVADSLLLLLLAAMLISTFSNTAQAAWQALIPDYVAFSQHGRAAGLKTVLELVGVVAGVAVVGFFLARGILGGAPLVTIGLFWAVLLATLGLLWRHPPAKPTEARPAASSPFHHLLANIRHAPPPFLWWTANRVLFWSAAITVRTFLLNYLDDVLGYTPAEAQAVSSQILILLGVGVFVLAVPAGAIADRVGRRPVLVLAGLMAAAGMLLALFWQDLTGLYVAGALIATGAGIYASASWSLAANLAPADKGALYLALANAATVVGSIVGRLGGGLIDGVNQLLGTVTVGYVLNFGLAALFFAASSLVALKIKGPAA